MPIPVLCPGCNVRLNAPDTAAGKNVKCPKCATLMTIPAASDDDDFEVVDEPPKKKASSPGSTRQPLLPATKKPVKTDVELDDDDDRPRRKRADDDDDRPKKKKGKKKAKPAGMSPGVLIAIGLGVLLLLGGGGVGIYFATRDTAKETAGGGAGGGGAGSVELPAGWVSFTPPNGGFKVNMSARPINADRPAPRKALGTAPASLDYTTGGNFLETSVTCSVEIFAFPDNMTPEAREKRLRLKFDVELNNPLMKPFMTLSSPTETTVAGKKATEVTVELDVARMAAQLGKGQNPKLEGGQALPDKVFGVVRWFAVENRGYMLTFATTNARNQDLERAFFGSFELVPETGGESVPPGDGPKPAGPPRPPRK